MIGVHRSNTMWTASVQASLAKGGTLPLCASVLEVKAHFHECMNYRAPC